MKGLKCFGFGSSTFGLGLVVGIALMGIVTSSVFDNISETDQEFEKRFKVENVEIGINVDEDMPEIREIAEDLTKEFANVLAGTIIICEMEGSREYFEMISNGMVYGMTMITNKLLEEHLEKSDPSF